MTTKHELGLQNDVVYLHHQSKKVVNHREENGWKHIEMQFGAFDYKAFDDEI